MLSQILVATVIVGLVSFIGVFVIFKKKLDASFIKVLVSIAAGTLLGAAFLDLLPEAIEESTFHTGIITGVALFSILVFFLFERVLHWHHCRDDEHVKHAKNGLRTSVIYTNLTGDALHNLLDGILIASAFMINTSTGITATVAVIIHEIPQEIADFGVLLHAGLTKSKALLYNFFIAITAIIGAVVFYYFGSRVEVLIPLMAAFAAGNFIYLATADLIPELHQETKPNRVAAHSAWLLFGVAIVVVLGIVLPHS